MKKIVKMLIGLLAPVMAFGAGLAVGTIKQLKEHNIDADTDTGSDIDLIIETVEEAYYENESDDAETSEE